MNRRFLIAAAACGLLAACASSVTTPTGDTGEGTPVYYLSAKQADSIMKKAMVNVFPNLPIMSVDVPHPGYTVTMDFLLDSHSITLAAIPSEGLLDGSLVGGHSFQVSQYGSIPITGSIKTNNIIDEIERLTAGVPQLE